MSLTPVEGQVWCDVHGEIHAQSTDPYQYGYAFSGESPECGPDDWRKVWIGGPVNETLLRRRKP